MGVKRAHGHAVPRLLGRDTAALSPVLEGLNIDQIIFQKVQQPTFEIANATFLIPYIALT